MAGTSVPQPSFTALGFVAPTASAVLTGVQADINASFGGRLNFTSNTTPQNQWSTSLTAMIDDQNAQFICITNQFDPALNSGRWQDGLGYLYFMTRIPAEATVVEATCTGKTTVVIPTGSLAKAADGNIYVSTGTGTISSGGTATIQFACAVTGPIPCPDGALNQIYQAIPGWDSITNAAPGVIGNNVETAAEFELRRQQSVALNSMGPAAAVQAAVLAVPGVLDAYTYDNDNNTSQTIQGVTIAANSLYCCVAGGNAQAIAQAIWTRKGPGCSYTGNTSETVEDTNSGYVSPFPSYTVTFEIPTALSIFFAVTIKNSAGVPSSALTQIQGAIQATFAGLPTNTNLNPANTRARIGGTIFASSYYPNIAALGPWASIVSVTVGSPNTTAATFTASISGTALTVSSVTGTIAIGQVVSGVNIAAGTQIVSGSGTSWVVNQTQTASSGAAVSVAVTLNDLTANLNQIPALNVANVFLTLV